MKRWRYERIKITDRPGIPVGESAFLRPDGKVTILEAFSVLEGSSRRGGLRALVAPSILTIPRVVDGARWGNPLRCSCQYFRTF